MPAIEAEVVENGCPRFGHQHHWSTRPSAVALRRSLARRRSRRPCAARAIRRRGGVEVELVERGGPVVLTLGTGLRCRQSTGLASSPLDYAALARRHTRPRRRGGIRARRRTPLAWPPHR
jgi:hypothetical protein